MRIGAVLLAQMKYQWNDSLSSHFSSRDSLLHIHEIQHKPVEWNIPVIAPTIESSELVCPMIPISVASAATTQSNSVIQHLEPPPHSALMLYEAED